MAQRKAAPAVASPGACAGCAAVALEVAQLREALKLLAGAEGETRRWIHSVIEDLRPPAPAPLPTARERAAELGWEER